MAIVKHKPTASVGGEPRLPVVDKTTFKGIVADVHDEPPEILLAYLQGMAWTVNYYGQLLGKHNDIREIDPGQNAAFQQYQKTNALELRVSSPLSSSYDSETGITTVSGSATIVYIVPNVNDYFIAEAGERELGLFRVTSVERRIFNRDSVYMIDYDLVSYARQDTDVVKDLEAKVVRTYYYSKDRLAEGMAPVLREKEYNDSIDLSRAYLEVAQRYFRTFFNRGMMTLLVPGQEKKIYDAWVVYFLSQVMDSFEAPELTEMRQISLDHDRYMAQGNLWSCLIQRDYSDVRRIHQKATLASRNYFNKSSWLRGPIYWSIDKYVYPLFSEDKAAVKNLNKITPVFDEGFVTSEGRVEDPSYQTLNTYVTGTGTLPLIKSVLIDDYYVLSKDFYDGTADLSVLEILVRDYLKVETINVDMLKALVRVYPDWPMLEQFYYTPLLLLLIKETIRGFYK